MSTPIIKNKDYHQALVASLAEAQAEIERLRADQINRIERQRQYMNRIAELEADKTELLAALKLVLPEIERLEFCEATSDDGFGPRLRALRGILNSVRVAIVKAESK